MYSSSKLAEDISCMHWVLLSKMGAMTWIGPTTGSATFSVFLLSVSFFVFIINIACSTISLINHSCTLIKCSTLLFLFFYICSWFCYDNIWCQIIVLLSPHRSQCNSSISPYRRMTLLYSTMVLLCFCFCISTLCLLFQASIPLLATYVLLLIIPLIQTVVFLATLVLFDFHAYVSHHIIPLPLASVFSIIVLFLLFPVSVI